MSTALVTGGAGFLGFHLAAGLSEAGYDVRLLDVVRRAGGGTDSGVRLVSSQTRGAFASSALRGAQLDRALLATHLNGERINLDHGYPVRLIAPNRAGVLNTKWLEKIVVS